nr:maltose acetyltransferase domain-containing protein [Lactobacillus delbrueckii]
MTTEKEKMLAGQVYNPGQDEELMAELAACKAKCLR